MTTELLIYNKRTNQIWEVSNSAKTVSWTTTRTGSPGTFKFTLIKSGNISFLEGDTVRFSVDGQLQFFGWVFTKSKDRWGVIDVTCYDRLRYLKASASYAFYGQSVGEIIRQMAGDYQIEVSTLAETGYKLPSLIETEQTCLDIISKAVQQTLLNTGKIFVFYDDGNGLSLTEAGAMKSSVIIGDKSLLTDYTYKTDIDTQTYNSIKLARPNDETGRADVFIEQDSNNIAQWGLLQLYQSVDGDVNDAQIKAQAQASLSYYNRRLRSVNISCLGIPGLRAGGMVFMNIPGLGDIDLNQYMLLEKVTHTWENDKHTMELETMAI